MTPNRRGRKRRLMGDINVVPYIDVMLVLLVIFMVTAPMLTQGIQVDLPKAAATPLDPDLLKDNEPLVLSIDAEGRYYLSVGTEEDAPIADTEVVDRAAKVLRRSPETPVLVKADRQVPFGSVVAGMVLLQDAGAAKVGFLTEPPPNRRQRP
jgi:biopolymer transport protein TolR